METLYITAAYMNMETLNSVTRSNLDYWNTFFNI